jgi:hypothetical protein
MRSLLIAAALLLPLASVPANACGAKSQLKAEAATAELSAQAKESAKKPAKKLARKPKEKVEYMRAAPMK